MSRPLTDADRVALAYEIIAAGALDAMSHNAPGLPRAWARYWLAEDDEAAEAAAARSLARTLAEDRWSLAAVAEMHGRLAEAESGVWAEDIDAPALAGRQHARLVRLLAGIEGEQASAAPPVAPRASEAEALIAATRALDEALQIIRPERAAVPTRRGVRR